MENSAIEIKKPNKEESDKDQSGEKPRGEELPRTVRRGWPKLEMGKTNGKDK
jgi:hypothetical protein